MKKEKYNIPKEFCDRKMAEYIKRIEEKEDKKEEIFEKIIHRFAEAVHYKIKRDILLYGVCVLKVGNTDDLDEIIEIRKMLDKDIENWEDMIRQIKSTKFWNLDTVTNIRE